MMLCQVWGYQRFGGAECFHCQGPGSRTAQCLAPEDRSPQPLTLRSAVAAVHATINEIVKVCTVHLTGSSLAEVVINKIMISVPFILHARNNYVTSKL